MPLAVFGETVEVDECIFLFGGRPVLAPRISLVQNNSSVVDELLGMLICLAVKHNGHGGLLLKSLPITSCLRRSNR